MKSLLVDTSTSKLLIAITNNDSVLFFFNENLEKELSSKFMVIMDEAFKKANLLPKDIDNIFVSIGPGSFTGIRIGMTFAKIYALLLNKKLYSVTSLELYATSNDDGYCCSMINARRGYVYSGIYDSNLNVISKDLYRSLSDTLKLCSNYSCKIYSCDKFDDVNTNVPNIDVIKVIKHHIDDTPINPHSLKPLYLKNTEAEDKLNGI